MSRLGGIYRITCWATEWHYVGMASYCFKERWRDHRRLLEKGSHYNPLLQADWTLFGSAPFEMTILEPIEFYVSQDFYRIIADRERDWIIRQQESGRCYNKPLTKRWCDICRSHRPISDWVWHVQSHVKTSRRPGKSRD